MSVCSKFNSLNGVIHPGHSRVDLKGCGPTRLSICEIPQHKQKQTNTLRITSLNVDTLRGRYSEVTETMSRRGIDLFCIQECRYFRL